MRKKASASATGTERPALPTHADLKKRKEEQECRVFLKTQQRLAGRKTTEDYANVRFVHRPDSATWKRSHRQHSKLGNGSKAKAKPGASTSTCLPAHAASTPSLQQQAFRRVDGSDHLRPLHTSRDVITEPLEPVQRARVRPQSAKPVLQSHTPWTTTPSTSHLSNILSGKCVNVRQLEHFCYKPVPLTTQLLAISQSAPRMYTMRRQLSSSEGLSHETEASDPVQLTHEECVQPGKRHLVVYLRRLKLDSDDDSEDDDVTTADQPRNPNQLPRTSTTTLPNSRYLAPMAAWTSELPG